VGDELTPVSGAETVLQLLRQFFRVNTPAADRFDSQLETEFQRDLFGVFGEDSDRARSDIAESDNADINSLHIGSG
jgi:hypothetical protein